MDEETDAGAVTETTRLPWGVRIASAFLGFVEFGMSILMWIAGITSVPMVAIAAAHEQKNALAALLKGFCYVAVVELLVVMSFGAGWLAKHLRASHGERWPGRDRQLLISPAAAVREPLLLILLAYSIVAIGSWLIVKTSSALGSYLWPIVWVAIGGASHFLQRKQEENMRS